MGLFDKKKSKELDSAGSPVFSVPVGAPLITGGSKIYALYQACSMALLMYNGFAKVNKKKARDMKPIVELWLSIIRDIEEYSMQFEKDNFSDL